MEPPRRWLGGEARIAISSRARERDISWSNRSESSERVTRRGATSFWKGIVFAGPFRVGVSELRIEIRRADSSFCGHTPCAWATLSAGRMAPGSPPRWSRAEPSPRVSLSERTCLFIGPSQTGSGSISPPLVAYVVCACVWRGGRTLAVAGLRLRDFKCEECACHNARPSCSLHREHPRCFRSSHNA